MRRGWKGPGLSSAARWKLPQSRCAWQMLQGPVITRGSWHPDPHATCTLLGTEAAHQPGLAPRLPHKVLSLVPWEMRATLGLSLGAIRVPAGWSPEVSLSSLVTSLQIYDVPIFWPVGV